MRKIIIDPGLIDTIEVGDAVMDWDCDKASVTDERGNKIGYVEMNDGRRITIWLEEVYDYDGEPVVSQERRLLAVVLRKSCPEPTRERPEPGRQQRVLGLTGGERGFFASSPSHS